MRSLQTLGAFVGIAFPKKKTADNFKALVLPPERVTRELVWPYIVAFIFFHAASLLVFVPELFSWTGVALVFIGNYVFDGWGISIGYHRLLTHKGFRCPKWLEYFLVTCGVMNAQDHPIRWVTHHRIHHRHPDQRDDPHTPRAGFFWGHIGWLCRRDNIGREEYKKISPDLMKDKYYRWLGHDFNWAKLYLAHAILFFAGGYGAGYLMFGGHTSETLWFAGSVFLWGVIVRTVFVWHITWAVNSICHRFGYRNYQTKDDSTNNWIIALLTHGEGWHNNHHKDQHSAKHGHQWWEIDGSWYGLLFLRKIGLVKDLAMPKYLHEIKD